MKNFLTTKCLTILVAVGIYACTANAQNAEEVFLQYWQEKDAIFSDSTRSPLDPAAIARFDSIPRFDYNEKFRVEAQWQPIEAAKPQDVLTTTGSIRLMQKAGVFSFELDGVKATLYLYRDLTMARMKPGNTSYFLPFNDLSNGESTYMGGRYMDLDEKLVNPGPIMLDFNLAYNPYCVYSGNYSCPIPPQENKVPLRIEAGARADY